MSTDPPLRSLLTPRALGSLWAVVWMAAACGGGAPASDVEEARRGADLVAGSARTDRGLLIVPHSGGTAELRALEAPARVVWEGRTQLPVLRAAYAVRDWAVLWGEDGRVWRYEPERDVLSEVGRVTSGRWTAFGDHGLLAEGRALLQVGRAGAWSYETPAAVLWASPIEGGDVVALLGPPDSAHAVVYRRGEAEPSASAPLAGATFGAVTAWGRRLAVPSVAPPGIRTLLLPELAEGGEVALEAVPSALGASPSSHELYAALPDRGELLVIGRLTGRERARIEVGARVTEIRPGLLGGPLLLRTPGGALAVAPGTEEVRPVGGSGWENDLPLGLPDGRVLSREGGRVTASRPAEASRRGGSADGARPAGAGADASDLGPAEAWWLVLRWRPPILPQVAEDTDPEDDEAGEELAAGPEPEAAEEAPDDEARVGLRSMPGQAEAASEEEGAAAPAGDGEPRRGRVLPVGYYAVVSSSRSAERVTALTRQLDEAGWPATVQRHQDEAREIWYRALVGPYPNREAAEGAALRIRRERGLQVWIHEVTPDGAEEEAGP